MSQQIQNSNPTSYSSSIENIFNQAFTEIENIQHSSKSEIPNIQEKNSHSTPSELPVLPRPSASALSLDSLVNSIGFEQRHINCRQGIARLEAKSAEQKEINQKELETLKEQGLDPEDENIRAETLEPKAFVMLYKKIKG